MISGNLQMKSANDHRVSVKRILPRIGAAALFGAAFWRMLESVQPLLLTPLYGYEDCCERCKNILYDHAQPLLAVSAAIAFLWVSLWQVAEKYFPNARELDVQGYRYELKIVLVKPVVEGTDFDSRFVSGMVKVSWRRKP
jgi:hypothetical protein